MITTERRAGQVLNSFLSHIVSGSNPVPVFGRLSIIRVDQGRTVHLMHSLFYVPFGFYSMFRRLLVFMAELSDKVLSLMVEIIVEDFAVQSAVHAVPRADDVSNLEGVIPSHLEMYALQEGGKDLSQG